MARATSAMSSKKKNVCTGVSLEPEVWDYLNDLSRRMRLNRSWVLNTIVHEYAQFMEHKQLKPLQSREELIRA